MTSVLVTAPIPQAALNILRQANLDVDCYNGHGLLTKAALLKRVVGKDYLITPLSLRSIVTSLMPIHN